MKRIPPWERYQVAIGDYLGIHYKDGTPDSTLYYETQNDGPPHNVGLEGLDGCDDFRYSKYRGVHDNHLGIGHTLAVSWTINECAAIAAIMQVEPERGKLACVSLSLKSGNSLF